MAISHVDLALATGLNDGTSWANAFQDAAGFVTAVAAGAAGDTIYVKNTSTDSASTRSLTGPSTLASITNPLRVIGVKSATTNEGGSIVQSDLIPGIRTGDSTRAYAQTAGNAPPQLDVSASASSDILIQGNMYMYGLIFKSGDNIIIANTVGNTASKMRLEECHFEVTGSGDLIQFGGNSTSTPGQEVDSVDCLFDANAGKFVMQNEIKLSGFNCDFDCTAAGSFKGGEYCGETKLHGCDLAGVSASGIVDVGDFHDGIFEIWNCKTPASHVLITGTATEMYTVVNYGSEDQTGLGSSDSEQQYEKRTLEGTVDIEKTVVRTGGANDGATGGFSLAVVANNVTDNFVGVRTPWMRTFVKGDGTAKTLTVFIANGDAEAAANLLEDDEIFLEVLFPSETGISMFDYLPNDGAPGDGGGRGQLLGTPADIATDSSVWASGGNNVQKLTQAIAPDYHGAVYFRLHYSKSASPPTLYVDTPTKASVA